MEGDCRMLQAGHNITCPTPGTMPGGNVGAPETVPGIMPGRMPIMPPAVMRSKGLCSHSGLVFQADSHGPAWPVSAASHAAVCCCVPWLLMLATHDIRHAEHDKAGTVPLTWLQSGCRCRCKDRLPTSRPLGRPVDCWRLLIHR